MTRIKTKLLAIATTGMVFAPIFLQAASFNTLPCVIETEPVKPVDFSQGCPSPEILAKANLVCLTVDESQTSLESAAKTQKQACKEDPASCGIVVADFDTLTNTGGQIPAANASESTPVEAYCVDDAEKCGITPEIIQDEVKAFCQESPSSNCGINQENILGAARAGETEPNNHFQAADPVSSDLGVLRGQIASESDQDWFSVTVDNKVTENGANKTVVFKTLVITLGASENTWHVSVRDQTGNILTSSNSTANPKEDFILESTVFVTKQARTYYVVIESVKDKFVDAPYNLTIKDKASLNTAGEISQANIHDTETEPNSEFKEADNLSSGVVLVGSLPTGGTRNNGEIEGDIDIFKFKTNGNETVNLALCPENTGCIGGTDSWAAFVFSEKELSASKLQKIANTEVPASIVDKSFCTDLDQNGICDNDPKKRTVSTITAMTKEFYIIAFDGYFKDALLASIDPVFGEANNLDFGLLPKGTYYVVVARVMQRNGATFLFSSEISDSPDTVSFAIKDRSDDPYTLRMTKTALTPNIETVLNKNKLKAVRAQFTSDKGILHVPEVKLDGEIYEGNLKIVPNSDPLLFELDSASKVANPLSE